MPDKYLVTGDHPVTLASGRPAAPGDTLPDDAVVLASDVPEHKDAEERAADDQQLVDDGVLVELVTRPAGKPGEKTKEIR